MFASLVATLPPRSLGQGFLSEISWKSLGNPSEISRKSLGNLSSRKTLGKGAIVNVSPLPRPLALQLYTLREEAADDLPAVLRRVAELGYVGVEPAGLYGHDPAEIRRLLVDVGLRVCSSHGPLPDSPDTERLLVEQALLGSSVSFPSLGEEWFTSRDQIERAADRFVAGTERASRQGLRLGYHNHWWEFTHTIEERPAYDLFLEALDARELAPPLEIDLYWVTVGGADPAELLERLGPRVGHVHVKDGPATVADPMTPVGSGTLDMGRILGSSPHLLWHIVELDRSLVPVWQAVAESATYLARAGLSAPARDL
jgi:sugar phosphate isomerase/epimerase